jgi:hypothetical protein
MQEVIFQKNTADYDDTGYLLLRVLPQVQRCMGFSARLESDINCIIISVDANIQMLSEAVATAGNTR